MHNLWIASECDCGNSCKRQLQTHYSIQEIIHPSQVFNVAIKGNEKGWYNCDDSSEKHSLPSGPLKVQKSFHRELPGIGSSHCGALACGKDANCPNIHRGHAETAPQEDSAFIQISGDYVGIILQYN